MRHPRLGRPRSRPAFVGAGRIPAADEIYLLISEAAYKGKFERPLELAGFGLDPLISTERTAVYVSPAKGKIIIGHRGTVPSDQSDLKQDALIIAGQFDKSDRLKRALRTVEDAVKKYPGLQLENTGHSLGGRVAAEIGKVLGGRVVTFNMGSSPADIASSLKNKAMCAISNGKLCRNLKMQTHYSTGIDPISFTTALLHGSTLIKPEQINVHSLSNFSA
jgi:hypothetical protein